MLARLKEQEARSSEVSLVLVAYVRQKIYNSVIFEAITCEINRLDRERDHCERCERARDILKVLLSHNVIWISSSQCLMFVLILSDKCGTHAAFDVTVAREASQAPKVKIASRKMDCKPLGTWGQLYNYMKIKASAGLKVNFMRR